MSKYLLLALWCCILCCPLDLSARELPQFVRLVKANTPAVVNITGQKPPLSKENLPEEFKTPKGEALFDELMERLLEEGGGDMPFGFDGNTRGSGFIYSSDGYIITNRHMINDTTAVKVKLSDRREFDAQVVGSDENTDIALLKIPAKGLPSLKMGSSQQLEVGGWVLAIGSPFGFEHSATAGIVSAKGRVCLMGITSRLSRPMWRSTPAILAAPCLTWTGKWWGSTHKFTTNLAGLWACLLPSLQKWQKTWYAN